MIKKSVLVTTIIIMLVVILGGCSGYFGPGTADYEYDLSGGYTLYKAGEPRIYKDDTHKIERNVTEIAWDKDFILAKQTSNDKTGYWIINIKKDEQYGLFDEIEFEKKRKELGINTALKLEKPEKYKSLDKGPIK